MIEMTENSSEEKRYDTLILGSGNILLGDDGFGPAVVDHLIQNFELPKKALALDVGTGIQEILFDLVLSDHPPEKILVVDVMDQKSPPGRLSWRKPDSLPQRASGIFSLHLPPAAEMLTELEKKGVEVWLLCCQPGEISETLQQGLSRPVSLAVLQASEKIYRILKGVPDFSE